MMKRYLVIAAALSCLATPSQAGLSEGIAAATAGNYAQAVAEFEPLANAGDPAAQYYLAKLYLEGHGPSNDVPRGVDLMTKAANGKYPEAQAQLGLMYAMGLGVKIDNAKAYDLLTQAVTALPDGTRRAVAVANRDAVLQRMTPEQRAAAGATAMPAMDAATAEAPAAEPAQTATTTQNAAAPEPAPAATEATVEAAPAVSEPATSEPAAQPAEAAPTPTTASTAEPAAEATPAPKPDQTAAAATGETAPTTETTAPETTATEAAATEPATTQTAAAEAPATEAPAVVDSEPEQSASVEVPADTPPPAAAEKAKTGVRIQMASLPSEDAAWKEWKRISKEFATQVGDLTANVETADLGTKGIFYRLQAGPFDTLAAAKDRCGKLKEAGLDCLVVGKE